MSTQKHSDIRHHRIQVQMYYGSGTVDRIAREQPGDAAIYGMQQWADAVGGRQTLWQHPPDGSTFLQ